MEEIVESQRLFFNTGKTLSIDFRIKILLKLKGLLQKNEVLLADAIYEDFKKSAFDNYVNELALVYGDIDEAVKKVKKWSSRKKVATNMVNFPAKSYVIPEPLGVSLVIGAWNYPYQLSLAPVVAAIAAGNTVVLKPSELPVNCSKVLAELINTNFDPSFFTVVEGGVEETTTLLNQKWDKIFFTGSVAVGTIVYQAAAKHLTPVTLELGGKSPAIITESCDLKISVKRLVWAKFLNAGQTCIAPDYVVVHSKVKEAFLAELKTAIEAASYSFENKNYVQIINNKNYERLERLIPKENVFFGGKVDSNTRYIAPTVLSEVGWDDIIMKDEIFGPILPVLEYQNLNSVITQIKSKPKPLALYVFTSNKETKNKLLKEVSFGGGAVNDALMHIVNSNLPFGGVGSSGIGAYHGKRGFLEFSHSKSILDKPTWFEPNLKYYPHSALKLKWIKRLMSWF